jgi:hypothetical protein
VDALKKRAATTPKSKSGATGKAMSPILPDPDSKMVRHSISERPGRSKRLFGVREFIPAFARLSPFVNSHPYPLAVALRHGESGNKFPHSKGLAFDFDDRPPFGGKSLK